eukprot:scaffold28.g7577.t1
MRPGRWAGPRHAHARSDELLAAEEQRPGLEPGGGAVPWRFMVALAALSVLICYADRSNISTAIISMGQQFAWDETTKGWVLSSFFAGYMLTQVLGGALADAYGGKLVLAAGVGAWSLCTFLTPEAAYLGLPALVVMRVAMGLGEGVAFPAIHSLISRRGRGGLPPTLHARCSGRVAPAAASPPPRRAALLPGCWNVPPERRSTAVAVVTAASYAGTALAFGLAPTIIEELSWPWVFYLFGGSAALWLPFWLPFDFGSGGNGGGAGSSSKSFNAGDVRELFGSVGSAPPPAGVRAPLVRRAGTSSLSSDRSSLELIGRPSEQSSGSDDKSAASQPPLLGPEEQQRLLVPQAGGRGDSGDTASEVGTDWSDGAAQSARGTGFAALLKTREVWAICAAQYTGSWGFYGLLSWLPSFFKDHYHVEIAQLATFTLLPYVVQGSVGTASGVLADKLIARGWPVRRVRRTLQTVGMLGPAACMVAAASPLTDGSPGAASAWITMGLGLNALTLAGVSVSQLDIAPKHAGVVFAAGNTAATAAGLLAVPVTGLMLDLTGSWALVFSVAAAHYVAGAAAFYAWVGDRPLPEDG